MFPPKTKMDSSLRHNLKCSVLDAMFYSLMVGLGENYLVAYTIAKGFSEISANFIATLPLMVAGTLQLLTPWLAYKLGNSKKFVLLSGTIHALAWLAMALTTFLKAPSFTLIFIIASIYWVAVFSTGAIWNTWINSLIPLRIRSGYFSKRNAISHFCVLVGLSVGGILLQIFTKSSLLMTTYFGIFLLAFLLRINSIYWLTQQTESAVSRLVQKPPSLREIIRKNFHSQFGHLITFMFLFQVGCYISVGFFAPLMFKELHFTYIQFMILIFTSYLTRIGILSVAPKLIKQLGHYRLLFWAAIGIMPSPLFWTWSHNYFYLILQQILTGLSWGLYELLTFLILFNDLPPKERTSILSLVNFTQNSGILVGSLAGGFLFAWAGSGLYAYEVVFDVSTCLRFAALLAFPGVIAILKKKSLHQF